MPDLLTAFALTAVVLTVAALASGFVERAPISFPIIFLGLGVLLGEHGVGMITLDPHDPALEVIATLTLALVLFLDAINLKLDEAGRDWVIPALALGPGTLLTISIVAASAHFLFDTTLIQSLLLGAILASTDPVVLRDVLRDERIPRAVRRALSIEAGTNDIVVLPAVLVLIAIANSEVGGVGSWLTFLGRLFFLGPAAGFIVGGVGAWAMAQADKRVGIRQEYQALYGIGLVLASYVVGVVIGGDGFLAAFAAGLAVTVLNFGLCDCFLEYGEVTAEMTMFLTFVLFGVVISSMVDLVPLGRALVFAVLVIGLARPLAMGVVLRRARASLAGRYLIGWFGPRGLNSLLLALLVLQAGVIESERFMALVGVVVMVSVVAHGASAAPLAAWYRGQVATETLAEERESSASGLFVPEPESQPEPRGAVPRISVAQLAGLLNGPNPPLVLDVRTRSQFMADHGQIPGSVRVLPDHILEWAADQERRDRLIVAYCT